MSDTPPSAPPSAPRNIPRHIAVTGGSGLAGRATLHELADHGYTAVNLDRARPAPGIVPPGVSTLVTDLADLGQVIDALAGCDSVIHLGAIPAPHLAPDQATFANNTLSTYNVFLAAKMLGFRHLVWASSVTTLGIPINDNPPAAAPITERDPVNARTSYAHSKVLGEEMGRYFHATAGITSAALRFGYIVAPGDYAKFEPWQDDPTAHWWGLWTYVDARDAAQACRLALETKLDQPQPFIITADDSVMRAPSAELMREYFPNVKLRDLPHERATLLSNEKAKKLLGYAPKHRWQEELATTA